MFTATLLAGRFFDGFEIRRTVRADAETLEECFGRLCAPGSNDDQIMQSAIEPAMVSHLIAVVNRMLFITAKGYIGLGPDAMRPGDEVAVLGGCPAPVILRPWSAGVGDTDVFYKVLDHCYVHGLMDGEAAKLDLPEVRMDIK